MRHNDYPLLGRALAARATFWWLDGNRDRGNMLMKSAFQLLDEDDHQTHSSAFQAFSSSALAAGNVDQASHWADKAYALIPREATYDQATLLEWRAEISLTAKDLPTAETLFRRSRDLVRPLNIFDCILRTSRLVQVLLQLGRHHEAVTEARDVMAAAVPNRSHQLVDAATIKLRRIARRSFEQNRREAAALIVGTIG